MLSMKIELATKCDSLEWDLRIWCSQLRVCAVDASRIYISISVNEWIALDSESESQETVTFQCMRSIMLSAIQYKCTGKWLKLIAERAYDHDIRYIWFSLTFFLAWSQITRRITLISAYWIEFDCFHFHVEYSNVDFVFFSFCSVLVFFATWTMDHWFVQCIGSSASGSIFIYLIWPFIRFLHLIMSYVIRSVYARIARRPLTNGQVKGCVIPRLSMIKFHPRSTTHFFSRSESVQCRVLTVRWVPAGMT